MSGGSPAPPYCPIRRLESCSKGWLVCPGTMSCFRRRLDGLFFGRPCLVFLLFAIQTSVIFFGCRGASIHCICFASSATLRLVCNVDAQREERSCQAPVVIPLASDARDFFREGTLSSSVRRRSAIVTVRNMLSDRM